jgi:hypothetical protein
MYTRPNNTAIYKDFLVKYKQDHIPVMTARQVVSLMRTEYEGITGSLVEVVIIGITAGFNLSGALALVV